MFLKPLSLIASVIALISLSLQVRGDVDIITRLCKFQDCFNLDENDARYTGLAYNKKLIQLFSSGISQLLFEDVDKLLISLGSEITPSCVKQLKQVSNSMDLGDEWAFRFLDASGKTPAAFLEGTVSSFGDYDECLDISSHNTDGAISGKYCMVDIFPRRPKKDLTPGRISLATPQHFNASAYYIGLCFPSACTVPDVRVLVKKVLEPFPLLVQGDLHCDTHETNSYLHLAKNIRIGPFISLIFLGCVFAAVAWGSLHHLLKWNDATEMQKGFSVFDNVHKLFYVAPVTGPPRTEFWDWIKNIGIVCGVAAHIMCGLESPIAFFVLSHHKNLEKIISNPAIASLFNEVGLTALTFLSGATTFMLAYPAARKGKLPFVPAILDRILRHLPGVASIIALDFTWYLWFSGPLYSRVGQIHVDKCSKTWWKGILMVSNLWGPSIEICAGHTFFSSVDVQLFILGFIGVKLLASRPKLGVLYCTSMVAISKFLMYYYAVTHSLTPTIMVARKPYIQSLEDFLIHIHMSLSGYVASFFAAILISYTVSTGMWKPYAKNLNHYYWVSAALITGWTQQYAPILSNSFDILTPAWTPFYIVGVRVIVIIQMSIFLVYLSLWDESVKLQKADKLKETSESSTPTDSAVNGTSSNVDQTQGYYSASKAFLRLSFSIYLSNYYFIRSDFFTERTLFYNTFLSFVKRLVSSMFFILVTSFVFQIIFLGPFTNLRVSLLRRLSAGKTNKKNE